MGFLFPQPKVPKVNPSSFLIPPPPPPEATASRVLAPAGLELEQQSSRVEGLRVLGVPSAGNFALGIPGFDPGP